MLCTIPGIIALCYFFSYGVLFQIALASFTAVCAEAIVAICRRRIMFSYLKDNSALLTGLLLGISLPPLAPWWVAVIGAIFAIIIAKQLYGGLGQNLFNPAMIAYVVLLIAFPVQMTTWLPPSSLLAQPLDFSDIASIIFRGFSSDGFTPSQLRIGIDGMTMATPLDTVKTTLFNGQTTRDAFQLPVFGYFIGHGWGWVNGAFLLGGLILLKLKVIQWPIPVAVLLSLTICSSIGYLINPNTVLSPAAHLFSAATMLGAFFIATDPVSGATTVKGRLIFGAMIGVIIFVIRTTGGFPDGVAFAVLLANMCVPLIDYYTKPMPFGYKESK